MPKHVTSLSAIIAMMDFLSEVSTLYRIEPGPAFRLVASNKQAQLSGVGLKNLHGKFLHDFIPRDYYQNTLIPLFAKAINTQKPQRVEQKSPFAGMADVMEILVTPVMERETCTHIWVITKYQESRKELEYLSTHDILTDIPNRRFFYQRLHTAYSRYEQHEIKFAVLYVDCDHFKQVNDSLGHDIGDSLLIQIAKRLKASIRENDFVARIGGDEFAILIEGIESNQPVSKVAERIIHQFQLPFHIQNHKVKATPSIGMYMMNNKEYDIHKIVSSADKALYKAKAKGRNNYAWFNEADDRIHT